MAQPQVRQYTFIPCSQGSLNHVQNSEPQQRSRPTAKPRSNQQSRGNQSRHPEPRSARSAPNNAANSDARRRELTAALQRELVAEFNKQPGKEL